MNDSATPTVSPARAPFGQAGFEDFLSQRHDPEWLSALRTRAFDVYRDKLSAPLDPEEWKRVDLRVFSPGQFHISHSAAAGPAFQTLLQDRAEFAGRAVHLDGQCTHASVSPDYEKQGVLFGDLRELAASHRSLLEPRLLKQACRFDRDRFSAWHAAFLTGGTVLYVPRNVQLEIPLYSLIALAADGAADFSHTLVVLEEGASATLLEETASASPDHAGLHVGAVELILEPGSRLRYVQLQNWNDKTWHFAQQAGRVNRGAFLQWTVGGLGAKLAHVRQDVFLDGQGAEAEVNGVTFASDRRLISYYTEQTHNAPDTRSDLLYKEVLQDRARTVWRGMIRVEPQAQKTDGYQRCDALLLSPQSRSDSIPGLEIRADDVRCTHGATAGRIDEEQIFYCMARGLPRQEAKHLIVEGFFRGVYDRIPVEVVRETLGQAVGNKLGIRG